MSKPTFSALYVSPSPGLPPVVDHHQNSLTRSAPLNSDSQGRFGNRFLSSYDHRFVIKTVSSEDIAEMHNILKKYHQVGELPHKYFLYKHTC